MEKFKIDFFEQEHNIPFPSYLHLSDEECSRLVRRVIETFQIGKTKDIEERINLNQDFLADLNATEEFMLASILKMLQIISCPEVYVNWYKFQDVDRFNLDDLDKYFDDVWYPSSDDVDIFDESLSWMISVRHDGVVKYLKMY